MSISELEAFLRIVNHVDFGKMHESLRKDLIILIDFLREQDPRACDALNAMEGK